SRSRDARCRGAFLRRGGIARFPYTPRGTDYRVDTIVYAVYIKGCNGSRAIGGVKTMKLGLKPVMDKGFCTNAEWNRRYLRMLDTIGVESIWTVEHPIVAEDYEP